MALDQDFTYASVDELKRYLRMPGTYPGTLNTEQDPYDDAELLLALIAASRAIDLYCNRTFGITDTTETRYYQPYKVDWHDEVSIDDVMTVSGLAIFSDDSSDYTYLDEHTNYRLHPRNAAGKGFPYTRIELDRGVTTNRRYESVAVTAKFGWTSVPDTIKNATLLQAARFFMRRNAPFGVAGSLEQGSEIRLLAKVDADVAVMCNPFKHWWI